MQTTDDASFVSPTPSGIDLNSDMGEGFGNYPGGPDNDLLPLVSSANIACGFHAGDPRVMERTVAQAAYHGVAVGAHPGFPDLVGFGRRTIAATPNEVRTDVLYQLGALFALCRSRNVELQHLKAHGALYNLAVKDETLADAIATAVRQFDPDLLFFALPGSALETAAESAGLRVAREAFADRAYHADGSLVSRSRPGAVLHDPDVVATRVVRMVREGLVEAIEGESLSIRPDTICLHSDTANALVMARAIRDRFASEGIDVRPVGETLGKRTTAGTDYD